jgi:N-acetyltransferase
MENRELSSLKFILENDRVALEPLEEKHFDLLWPIAAVPELWRFTTAKIFTKEDFRNYFNQALQEKSNHLSYPFAIYDKQENRYGGSTRFGNINLENKRSEIGWTWYHPELQRSGLNRNCKFLLLSFAFETLGLHRVEFKTSLTNIASQQAIEKIGASREGVLRKHMINADGSTRDTVYFSIIDEEWPGIKTTVFAKYNAPFLLPPISTA